jgi:hypothetical protein
MVGDDDVGPPRAADRLLHEAGAVVGAAGVDALAAPGPPGWPPRPCEAGPTENRVGSQAGKSPPVMSPSRVARTQRGAARSPPGRPRPAGRRWPAPGSSEAQVVLAPLAHHGLPGAHLGVRIERAALALDLPLQGARVGGDPDRRPVGLGPEGGGRQVPQGLADPGPGLRPASCAARLRARAAGTPRRSRRHSSAWAGRASSRPWAVSSSARRARAWSGSTGLEVGSPGGASASHSPSRCQTSRPEERNMLPAGCDLSAPSAEAPHDQPARARVSASAMASSREGVGAAASSASRVRAASCRVAAWSCGVRGSARPSAWARPAAEGAVNCAGRVNAKSSSTSKIRGLRGGAWSPAAARSSPRARRARARSPAARGRRAGGWACRGPGRVCRRWWGGGRSRQPRRGGRGRGRPLRRSAGAPGRDDEWAWGRG